MHAHVHVHWNADEDPAFEWDAPEDEPLQAIVIVGHEGMVEHRVTDLENEGLPILIRIVSKDQSVDVVPPAARKPFEPVPEEPAAKSAPKSEEKVPVDSKR